MKARTKRYMIISALLLLVLINIGALGYLVYLNLDSQDTERPSFRTKRPESLQEKKINQFVKHTLDLSDDQYEQFRTLRKKRKETYHNIIQSIHSKQQKLIDELTRNQPDTARIDSLINDIGVLHKTIKQETVAHYLELKQICTPQQREKLQKLWKKMGPERGMKSPRNGHQRKRAPHRHK